MALCLFYGFSVALYVNVVKWLMFLMAFPSQFACHPGAVVP